jgi:anthranilate phosphoribosyltransferase
VLGVGRPELRPLLAHALARLGTEHAVVVHGEDGLCEITLAARTLVTEIRGTELREHVWSPSDFGIREQPLDDARVDGPEASAEIIQQVLAGKHGAARDLVVLNAAAALWVAGQAKTLLEGATLAQNAVDSGAARTLLARLIEKTA